MCGYPRYNNVTLFAVLVLLAGSVASAEDETSSARERTTQASAHANATGSQSADQQIAAWLGIGNAEEVALGQFAEKNAKKEQVREFAQMMVKDHGDLLKQLSQFAPEITSIKLSASGRTEATTGTRTGATLSESVDTGDTLSTAATTESGAGTRGTAHTSVGAAGHAGGLDVTAVKRQIAERCLAATQRELLSKPAEFDKAYVGQQIVAHVQMIATQEVLRQHASPRLQKLIDEGIAGAKGHLEHAKEIKQSLMAARGEQAGAHNREAAPRRRTVARPVQ